MSSVNVKGLSDLQAFLNTLPAKMEKNIMRGALRAGANVVKAEAKAKAPVGSSNSRNSKRYGGYAGALRDSIKVSTKSRGGKVSASVKVGGKNKKGADVYYAHMVEYGTRPHKIAGKDGRLMYFAGRYIKSVNHPGTRPRPFLRPALDSQASAAVIASANYIKKRLSTKHGLDTPHIEIKDD